MSDTRPEARPASSGENLVEMRDIHKWFGPVYALRGMNITVRRNEILGLIGDNGAGKSTLIKILSGFHLPDKGEIWFEGKRAHIQSPRDAKALGIETVYQEQALAPHVSISRNVFMGREPTIRMGFLDRKLMARESLAALEKIGLHLRDPESIVETLSGGQRQGVAIARVLYFKAKLVILDEPTIALSVKESQQVMDFMKQLRDEGLSVVFITHNMYHAYQVAERYVIITHGEKTADVKKADTSIDHLAELVIGAKPVGGRGSYEA